MRLFDACSSLQRISKLYNYHIRGGRDDNFNGPHLMLACVRLIQHSQIKNVEDDQRKSSREREAGRRLNDNGYC